MAPPVSHPEELWLRAAPQQSADLLLESWSLSGPAHPHSVLAAGQSPQRASLHPPRGWGMRETVVCCGKRNSVCRELRALVGLVAAAHTVTAPALSLHQQHKLNLLSQALQHQVRGEQQKQHFWGRAKRGRAPAR